MKNKTVKLMAVFMAVAMAMTACGDSGGDSKESSGDNQEKSSAEESSKEEESSAEETGSEDADSEDAGADGGGSAAANIPAFEDIEFADALPVNPPMADDVNYDYDDMSVHYDLVFQTLSLIHI